MNNTAEQKKYALSVTNNSFTVEGVTNVSEYSDKTAIVKINGGVIEINGTGINLISLDTEKSVARFSGNVVNIKISDKYVKSGLVGKLFR